MVYTPQADSDEFACITWGYIWTSTKFGTGGLPRYLIEEPDAPKYKLLQPYHCASSHSRGLPRSTVWPTVKTKPYIAAFNGYGVWLLFCIDNDTLHILPRTTLSRDNYMTLHTDRQHLQRVLVGQYRGCLSVIDGITDRLHMGLRWPSRTRGRG